MLVFFWQPNIFGYSGQNISNRYTKHSLSDYAVRFPNHSHRALPLVRWGSLFMAMGLSAYLAQAYQANLQGSGMWIFLVVVFIIITLSKLAFKWLINRQRSTDIA